MITTSARKGFQINVEALIDSQSYPEIDKKYKCYLKTQLMIWKE